MVGGTAQALLGEPLSQTLGGIPARAVNDAALAVVPLGYVQNLVQRLAASDHPVDEVAAIETGDETTRIAKLQLRDDVLPHAIGRSGSQRHHRCLGKTAAQCGDLPVLRAKVMTPLADAVSLVNGDQPRLPSGQAVKHFRQHQPLRRNVQQAVLTVVQLGQTLARLGGGKSGIKVGSRHTGLLKCVDLIFHQSDQRRDNDGQSALGQSRQLVAKRFAAAGRHQHECVVPGQGLAHHLLLQRPKRLVAEEPLQQPG